MLDKVTVYSKDGCPHCEKVCKVMKMLDASYVEYKLDKHFTKEEFYQEFGEGSTFPQVLIGDSHIGGCNETVKYLKENGIV